jgi:hypothetical protein
VFNDVYSVRVRLRLRAGISFLNFIMLSALSLTGFKKKFNIDEKDDPNNRSIINVCALIGCILNLEILSLNVFFPFLIVVYNFDFSLFPVLWFLMFFSFFPPVSSKASEYFSLEIKSN